MPQKLTHAGAPATSWTTLGLVVVLLLAGLFAAREIDSLDTGFHLAAGAWIVDNLAWPDHDPLTYTLGDRPYVDTSWGYQIVLVAAERFAGSAGVVLFHALLVVAAWLVTWRTMALHAPLPGWAPLALLLAVVVAEPRFHARPELLSYVLLALTLYVVERYRRLGEPRPLVLLPPLFLLWANAHALFLIGLLALGAFVAGSLLERRGLDRPLLRWSAAAALATLVNPYGWHAHRFALSLSTRLEESNPFAQTIGEFMSPFELVGSPLLAVYPWSAIGFFVLGGLGSLALASHARARRWGWLLLTLGAIGVSLRMVRNVPLLALCALPGLAWMPWRLPVRVGRAAAVLAAIVALPLGARVVTDAYYVDRWREDRFGLDWNRTVLPLGAARFAERSGLTDERVLNHLNFGGTLLHDPGIPVFIDGRLEVVGEAFYARYVDAMSTADGFERTVREHDVGWVVFPHKTNGALLSFLSGRPDWKPVYFDGLSAVFARSASPLPDAVSLLAAPPVLRWNELPGLGGPARPSRLGRCVAGFAQRRGYPSERFGRGLFHARRREHRRAAAEFAAAIAESRGAYVELYKHLGIVLGRLGDMPGAAACLRLFLEERPNDREARELLAATGL